MRYLATGRILPERAYVSFSSVNWQFGERGRVSAYADAGQLSVLLDVAEIDGWSSARIFAEHMAHIAVAALGFALGSGYGVEIIQVFEEDCTPHVFGVRHEELRFETSDSVFNRAIRLASDDLFFRLALRDYVRGINDATDCAAYCYRAIEAVQASFAFRTGKNDGWAEMHRALGTDRESIERTVKPYADPIRHGNWASAKPTDGRTRTAILLLTREVLKKYLEHERPEA